MVSKLKQRRMRRLKADLWWWREEAKDLHARVMEQADEIAALRKLVIRVPMPVLVTKDIAEKINSQNFQSFCPYCGAERSLSPGSIHACKEPA